MSRHHLRRHQAGVLANAILRQPPGTVELTRLHARRSSETDKARLRGIPIQGATTGTQLGSRPGAFIDRIRDEP